MPNRLTQTIVAAWGRTLSRYIIIGVSVYAFEVAVILIAQRWGASALVAVSISFWAGLVLSFLLQKIVTFGDKRMHRKVLLSQVGAYSLLVMLNFGFTLLVTHLLVPSIPAVLARTIALVATTIWNFYLYKTRIFNVSDNPVY